MLEDAGWVRITRSAAFWASMTSATFRHQDLQTLAPVRLDLDLAQAEIGGGRQHLGECRDPTRLRPIGELRASVECPQLGQRQVGHRAGPVGGAINRGAMDHHELFVGGAPHVILNVRNPVSRAYSKVGRVFSGVSPRLLDVR